MTEVKKSEHRTPHVAPEVFQKDAVRVLSDCYGHLVQKCGYCGGAKLKGYICDCGFQLTYADERDEDGGLIQVWSD